MIAVLFGAVVLTGCAKKDAATINVKVLKNGQPVVGEFVYKYRSSLGESFLTGKIHADQEVATDEQGVAEFKLSNIDFGAGSSTASFVFETFDSKEVVNGKIAASVNKGQTKEVTINQR